MPITLPPKGRDLRLDVFRGIACWAIFINHVPDNFLSVFTLKNFGFSDFADVFVFISGFTGAFVYSRIMLERGFLAGTSRILRRAWQVYAVHIFLLAFYVTALGLGSLNYNVPPYKAGWGADYNITIFTEKPVETMWAGLTLQYMPVNMDILPLYVILLAFFPLILWSMLRKPDLTLLASVVFYFAARHWGWNLPRYGAVSWYFNPCAWQLLFVFGAWCAVGGAKRFGGLVNSGPFVAIGSAYLIFALVIKTGINYAEVKALLPEGLLAPFIPNDKSNLEPHRLLHMVIVAAFTAALIPRSFKYLESRWLKPAVLCGRKSLEVFALGTMLSYLAYFYFQIISGSLLSQVLISSLGIGIMCLFAYMISKWKGIEAGQVQPVEAELGDFEGRRRGGAGAVSSGVFGIVEREVGTFDPGLDVLTVTELRDTQ